MIELRTLGSIDLRGSEGSLNSVLAQPKRLALLSYLATSVGAYHRRDVLVEVFWPALDHGRARANLRRSLYMLRRSLGPGVLDTRGDEEVRLDPERFRCDASAFETAVEAERWESALELYRGEYLPGLHLSDAPGFERWIDERRHRFNDLAMRAASALLAAAVAEGSFDKAAEWAVRALRLAPYDEQHLRALLDLLDRLGRRGDAVVAFERFSDRLRSDLDLEPSPETVALVAEIRGREEPSTLVAAPERSEPDGAATPSAPEVERFEPVGSPREGSPTGRLGWIAAGGLTVALAIAAWMVTLRTGEGGPTRPDGPRWTQATFDGNVIAASLSPDGRALAYVAGDPGDSATLYLKDLGGGRPLGLARLSSRQAWSCPLAWSPDGSRILCGRYLVGRLGGETRSLQVLPGYATWSPDGTTLASWSLAGGRVLLTGTATGDTSSVPLPDPGGVMLEGDWSPAGDRLVYVTTDQRSYFLWTTSLDGTRQRLLLQDTLRIESPRWSSDEESIYYLSNSDALRALRISPRGMPAGDPELLMSGLQVGPGVLGTFSVSADGRRLAYAKSVMHSNLLRVAFDGRVPGRSTRAEPLTTGTRLKFWVRVSPDGESVAYVVGVGPDGPNDLFIMSVEGGKPSRLTFTGGVVTPPAWSPDGTRIAFGAQVGGRRGVWIVRPGSRPEPIEGTAIRQRLAWAPGERIAYERYGTNNIHLLDPVAGDEELLFSELPEGGWVGRPVFSPDGSWLAWLESGPRGPNGVWAMSLADRAPVFLGSGAFPTRWTPDGKAVYAHVSGDSAWTIFPLEEDVRTRGPMRLPPDCRAEADMILGAEALICVKVRRSADAWVVEDFDPEVRGPTPPDSRE